MKTLNNIKKIWGAALIGIASFMLQGCQEAAQKGDGLLMTGTSSDRLVKFAIDGFPSAYAVSVTSTSRVESDIQVNLAVDASLVDTYNEEMGTNYYPIPDKSYTFENPEVTISAGQAISSAASLSIADDSEFVPGRGLFDTGYHKKCDGRFGYYRSRAYYFPESISNIAFPCSVCRTGFYGLSIFASGSYSFFAYLYMGSEDLRH